MSDTGLIDLASITRRHLGRVYHNLASAQLVEQSVRRREGHLTRGGALAVRTGQHTERSLDASYLVEEGEAGAQFALVGEPVTPLAPERFAALGQRLLRYLQDRDVFVLDARLGPDEGDGARIRVITETAWHGLLARNLYRPAPAAGDTEPAFTVVHAPGFHAVPEIDGTAGTAFTIFHPAARCVYVGGTRYGGELRKAVLAMSAARLPSAVLPLWAAASVDPDGRVALFLGRTGNGKTSLALDPGCRLLADHGLTWGPQGLTALERGIYASVLGLEQAAEPLLYEGATSFGAVLENVAVRPQDRALDFADDSLAQNTRAAFSATGLTAPGASGGPGHPHHAFLITRDLYGVLPPIARLTPEQAVFAFLISYLSSLVDTEAGLRDTRPQVDPARARSARVVSPDDYAKQFMARVKEHDVTCWFLNTGWVGEPMGRSQRIPLEFSRAAVRAAVSGALDAVPYEPDPLFLFEVPKECPDIPEEWLDPRARAADPADYEVRANQLARAFLDAFALFEESMPGSVLEMLSQVVLFEETLDVMEAFRLSF